MSFIVQVKLQLLFEFRSGYSTGKFNVKIITQIKVSCYSTAKLLRCSTTINPNNRLANCFPFECISALGVMTVEWKTYPSAVNELPHPSNADLAFRDSFV